MVHSNSTGAIGILGVKKSVDGVWLYFAHNTDTFVSLRLSFIACLADFRRPGNSIYGL